MELSFSSERDEYDDDPTATRHSAAAPVSNAATASRRPVPPLPPPKPARASGGSGGVQLAPLQHARGGWGSSDPAPAAAASKEKDAKQSKKESIPKPRGVASATVSAGNGETTVVEAVEAFNSGDMSPSSRSNSDDARERRKQEREERRREMEARRREREAAAPGAIEVDTPRKPESFKPASAAAAAAASSSSAFVTAAPALAVGQSMIAGMQRKGGKGAFAPTGNLQFSSDEEEEGANGGRKRGAANSSSAGAGSGGSAQSNADRAVASDVAPLINPTALDFVLRRWSSTLLGGMIVCWSAQPSEARMPGVPGKIILAQFLLLLLPAAAGLGLNAASFYADLQPGFAALIAGGIVVLLHVFLHSVHRLVLRQRPGGTRVADFSASASAPAALGDEVESALQQLVRRMAARDGRLPKRKVVPEPLDKKKKHQEDDDEDDPSLPPGVSKRPTVRHDCNEEDEEAAIGGSGSAAPDSSLPASLSLLHPLVQRFVLGSRPRPLLQVLLGAMALGTLVAGFTFLCDWSFLALVLDGQDEPGWRTILFLALGWISACLALFGPNVRAPTEPALWSASGSVWDEALLRPYTRGLYLAALVAFHLALRLLAESDGGRGLWTHTSPIAWDVHEACLWVHCTLPMLFALGMMPPPDALAGWAMEQLNVVAFGSTPAASEWRAFGILMAHCVATGAIILMWLYGSQSGGAFLALGLALPLARNLFRLSLFSSSSSSAEAVKEDGDPEHPFPHFSSPSPRLSMSWALSAAWVAACVGGSFALAVSGWDLLRRVQVLHEADIAFDLVLLACAITMYVARQTTRPFLFFDRLRNPFYERRVLKPLKGAKNDLSALDSLARVRMVLDWIVRTFLALYVLFHLDPDLFREGLSFLSDQSAKGRLELVAYSALTLRAFVLSARDPYRASLHALLVALLNQITSGVGGDVAQWHTLSWTVRFLIAGFVWDRFWSDLLPKLWFWSSLTRSSFSMPKLRMRGYERVRAVWWILLPWHLAVLLLSSFLGTPVLPLLGSPILLLAFPRPRRVWPSWGGRYGMNEGEESALVQNGAKDTTFYRHQFPGVYAALDALLRSGLLVADAGDVLLLRSEPYLVYVCVLEKGLDYAVLQLKGLELATTSCHTVEALRLDENIEAVLQSTRPATNPLSVGYAYAPLLTLPPVRSFSLTRNVLTGLLDSPDTLALLQRVFVRVLLRRLKAHTESHGGVGAWPQSWRRTGVSAFDLSLVEESGVWPHEDAQHVFSLSSGSAPWTDPDRDALRVLVLSLYALVESLSGDMVGSGGRATTAHVLRVFNGEIGSSLHSDVLLADSPDARRLKQLVVDSYRASVKLVYDCVALAMPEALSSLEADQIAEFESMLAEIEKEWYIAPAARNPEWERLVGSGERKLFTIAKAVDGSNKSASTARHTAQHALQQRLF